MCDVTMEIVDSHYVTTSAVPTRQVLLSDVTQRHHISIYLLYLCCYMCMHKCPVSGTCQHFKSLLSIVLLYLFCVNVVYYVKTAINTDPQIKCCVLQWCRMLTADGMEWWCMHMGRM